MHPTLGPTYNVTPHVLDKASPVPLFWGVFLFGTYVIVVLLWVEDSGLSLSWTRGCYVIIFCFFLLFLH